SGLRIVTERMPGVRSVTLGIWVAAGSRDERPDIAGASHFLEHLLFKGTPTRDAREIAETFEAVGGDLNAFTAKENTCFYARVLDRDLPMAVEYLCDMLQNSVLRKPDFEAERQVILEEINMHEDSPDELIHDLFTETLWTGHPLGRPVLGTVQSITSTTRDQVKRFYARLYTPARFVVVAAGNLEHDEVVGMVTTGMEAGKERQEGPAAWRLRQARDAPKPSGATLVRQRPTEQAHICLGTNGLPRGDDDRFAFGIANMALGGGMSSRLFQEVREKRGLAYSVYSYHGMYAETGVFAVYAGTTPSKAQEVLDILRREVGDIRDGGLTEEEFTRAKGHMKGALVLGLEDTSGRMSRLGKSEIAHGEILSVDETLDRIDAVTLDDARRVAERVLSQPMALAVIGPFDEDAFGGSDSSAELATAALHGAP
ncbi:MAG: M16 family metallopeptidase, partial [Actinomycetota bacterium]